MRESGGLLGSAELSIKRALQIATTAKRMLAISEYEKSGWRHAVVRPD